MAIEGNSAPDATFAVTGDVTRSIKDYQGQKLILYFYPKDDTSGCTKEAQEFTERFDDFAKAGAVLLGASKDSIKSHDKFAAKYNLKVELASDEDGSLCEAFGVWVEKSMYGKKYMGIERSTFLIDAHGKVAQVWRKVKVPGHVAEVLEATKAL